MIKTISLAAIFLGAATAACQGQEAVRVDALDFLVDWPNLVGQRVAVTGGKVAAADQDSAMISMPGGNVFARQPWVDREDLRYLFKNCTGLLTGDNCRMTVIGTVAKAQFEDKPELTGTDFVIPEQ